MIFRPGAKTSTHLPWFEKYARLSEIAVAPTVIGPAAEAGDEVQASRLSFPAATANKLKTCT